MDTAANGKRLPPDQLTSQSLIALDFVAPSTTLAPFVTTFFRLRCNETEIRDMLPAGVGYLVVLLHGHAQVHFPFGHSDSSHPVMLLTPSSQAVTLEGEGPLELFGATLSPLGWAALTGLAADRHGDRLLDAVPVLGPSCSELGARIRAAVEANADATVLSAIFGAFVGERLRPVNPRHAAFLAQVGDWLSGSFDPPLEDLLARAAYSERQVERLVRRYFGVAPRELVRKYRIARVAALLQAPDTDRERVAELFNLFYDQSHLIREMRRYIGRTPTMLAESGGSLLGEVSGIRAYREVKPNFARLPGD